MIPVLTSPRPRPAAAPEISELAHKLPTVLTRLQRRLRQTSAQLGVPPGYFPVLSSLLDRGSATVSELAAQEQVRLPSMTNLLVQMESDGLVLKGVDRSDRRFVRISLTRRGAAVGRSARQARGSWFAERLEHLNRGEVAALERALPALEHLVGVER